MESATAQSIPHGVKFGKKNALAVKKEPVRGILFHTFYLFKPGISLFIALSAMLGYLIRHPRPDGIFYITGFFTFLLCAGSGGLNNCQDKHRDKALERTRNRLLPRGILPIFPVLTLCTLLIFVGLAGLGGTRQPLMTMGLGLVGVILYNGIYTPLKSHTTLAILPGALCGMVPPALGWFAAGGTIPMDPTILSVMGIFGVWQLPHYWLVLMCHKDDYQASAIPSMLTLFSTLQVKRILLLWVLLFSTMTQMMPLFLPHASRPACWILELNGIGLSFWFMHRFFLRKKQNIPMEFKVLNLSMGVFMVVLMMNQLLFP